LGQDKLFDDTPPSPRPYVSFVDAGDTKENSLFSVPGTIIIQSAVPGKGGALNFIGDDAIINSLGLSTIRASVETKFLATIMNAHDESIIIAENVEFEGNLLVGILHPNVDVEISSTTSLVATMAGDGTIEWEKMTDDDGEDVKESTYIHLADRSMVFHVGANSLQDVNAAIGNMSSSALGLDGLLVTTNPLANKAIRTLDLAIDKVSYARSKLGAVQNRLDHTVSNLTEMQHNLTAALSRIQDADMAKEMTEFTKNNIILQAATAMLAQANQLPQNVLQLLR
jgi:flagellin